MLEKLSVQPKFYTENSRGNFCHMLCFISSFFTSQYERILVSNLFHSKTLNVIERMTINIGVEGFRLFHFARPSIRLCQNNFLFSDSAYIFFKACVLVIQNPTQNFRTLASISSHGGLFFKCLLITKEVI